MRLRPLILGLILTLSVTTFAQDTLFAKKADLAAKTTELGKSIVQLRRTSAELNRVLSKQQRKLSQVEDRLAEEKKYSTQVADSLKAVVGLVQQGTAEAKVGVSDVKATMNQHMLLWIVAILGLLLFGVVLSGLLQRKMVSGIMTLDRKIDAAKQELETKTIKLDQKVVELLGTQLLLLKDERSISGKSSKGGATTPQTLMGEIRTIPVERSTPRSGGFIQCEGTTRKGKRCTRKAVPDSRYCTQHTA
jgi:hypothetical protein